jgi:hypothetical protein
VGAIQYLLEDKAGTVYFDVPRSRPASGTVTISTAGGGDLPDTAVEDAAVTVETFTRLVDTWVATAPRDITLQAGAGTPAVGRRYLARTTDDRRETVQLAAVDGLDIEITDDLPFVLASGDTIESTRITYALTADQLATRGLFRCAWTYVDDAGDTLRSETLFRTVRAFPHNPGTAAGLRMAEPDLITKWDQFVNRTGTASERLAAAWEKVLQEVEGKKILDGNGGPIIDKIVDWSQGEETVYRRVFLEMAPTHRPSDDWSSSDWVTYQQSQYKRAFDLWMSSVRWIDDDDGNRVQSGSSSGKDVSTVRFSR